VRRLHVFLPLSCCAWLAAPMAEAICPPLVCCPPRVCPPLPTLWVWPDVNPPCDGTLQACIEQAAPGDGVQIRTNGPISESVSITKSLTLRAAQGFAPAFAAGESVAATLSGTDASASQSIDVEGLSFDAGQVSVTQAARGPLSVRIAGNTFTDPDGSLSNKYAIFLATGGGTSVGKVTFDVSGNDMTVPLGIFVGTENGAELGGRVNGNVISSYAGESGILFVTGNAQSLSMDVIGNRISGPFHSGIALGWYSYSTTGPEIRILDNLVVGQAGSSGSDGAIMLDGSGSNGTVMASVVNNTVADGEVGIVIGSGSFAGLVANNIVSGNSGIGISIPAADAATLPNRNDLVFANGDDHFSPGLGTIIDDPHFAGVGDYHLQPGSKAIDAGDNDSVPATDIDGSPITDLDDNPRIRGQQVDIGAYETVPEPTAEMLAVTTLAALVGFVSLRRPTHQKRPFVIRSAT